MISLLKTDLKVMRNCLFKVSFAKIWRIGLHLHLDSFWSKAEKKEKKKDKRLFFIWWESWFQLGEWIIRALGWMMTYEAELAL